MGYLRTSSRSRQSCVHQWNAELEVKQYLNISGKKLLNKDLKQALMLVAVKAAAGPPMRPQDVKAKAPMGTMLPVTEHSMTGHLLC